ncbi:MAG: hypothetical protein MK098_11250 [Marinovum sp.]|nr:hypothetical protein [Marinovum sp.]
MIFDRIVAVDWSARSSPSSKCPTKDAIFMASASKNGLGYATYFRTRQSAMEALETLLHDALACDERVLCGFDFAFGTPRGFAEQLTGKPEALAVWDWLATHIQDWPDNANNRFEVAAKMNRAVSGVGPFWGHPSGRSYADLPERGSSRAGHGLPERRAIEEHVPSAHSVWKLFTTGSVGSQSLLGQVHLQRLRARYADAISVWPLQTGWQAPATPIALVEIYPSLYTLLPPEGDEIIDARQVRAVAQALWQAQISANWAEFFLGDGDPVTAREEGWIFGVTPDILRP